MDGEIREPQQLALAEDRTVIPPRHKMMALDGAFVIESLDGEYCERSEYPAMLIAAAWARQDAIAGRPSKIDSDDITPVGAPPRLHQAMQLIVDEVKMLLDSDTRFDPQNFVRVDKLMRICKAIKHQCISVDKRLHPIERNAARGLGCMMPGVNHGDIELGLGDAPEDYGPVVMPNPWRAPHQDRDVQTEQSLALIESLAARRELDAAKLRSKKLDEALSLQKLIDADACTEEQRAILSKKIAEIVQSYGEPTDAPALTAPDPHLVPADDVR